jgi:hypothetical protein
MLRVDSSAEPFTGVIRGMRSAHAITITTFLIATLSLGSAGRGSEPPAKTPVIPALIVGAPAPASQSFVVDGVARPAAESGLAFHVARDGDRQLCTVYDAADGTPILLSDGRTTLIYDLVGDRIIPVAPATANVRIDWERAATKPLEFQFNAHFLADAKKLETETSWFRIDKFVEASGANLKRLDGAPAGTELFGAERAGGSIESVQRDAKDPSWFRFTSVREGQDYYALDLRASDISKAVPDRALAFPDLAKLGKSVPLAKIDEQDKAGLVADIKSGKAWAAKLAIAGGQSFRERLRASDRDWEALRKRDEALGNKYRAALAEQGIRFAPVEPSSTAAPGEVAR